MVQSLASQFARYRVLKFFKIDLSLNDIPELRLEYSPSFGVYLRDDKSLRLYEEETISYKKVLDFVNGHTKLLSQEEFEKLKREADAAYLDELIVSKNMGTIG